MVLGVKAVNYFCSPKERRIKPLSYMFYVT